MKVIGSNADNSTYILQVSKEELCNILGYYGPYEQGFKDLMKVASNGKPIQVSPVYSNYYKVKCIVGSAPYDTAVAKLEEMLEAIEPINKLIKEIKETYEAN